ncbi:Golgi transport complex subunit 3 [Rhodotorula sphaerocarpa]
MASSRASTSRLSLDDWDQLAPLSAAQQHSANRVHHAALAPALPQHLRQEAQAQAAASRPQTPLALSRSNSGSLDRLQLQETLPGTSTPSQRYAAKDVRGPSGGRDEDDGDELEALLAGRIDPVATTNQFHEWFSRVEGALDRDQESVYVDHLAQLARHLDRCRTVLDGLDEARGLASEIEANNRYVDENSAALQLACETLLDEQRHLVEVTEALSERLAYFRQLEKATRMLNLPGEHLVLNDDFLNLVDRLDACLEYLRSHGDFVDSEIYAIRFQQCLTRAMTLIKMYFVSTTRKVANEAAAKMAGKDLSETAQNALLYNKFSASAPTLRILLFELEKRAHSDPSEYASLLSECYSTWFAARSQLLSPLLAEEVRRMDPGASSTDLVKLAKAGCGYLRGVCAIEWNLFREFFSSGQDEL